MATYQLRCVMRFTNGRTGSAFTNLPITAETPEAAIALAKAADPVSTHMTMDAAVLSDEAGKILWSLRAPAPVPTPARKR